MPPELSAQRTGLQYADWQFDGEDILYGPGIRIELPPGEPITQMLMTIVEEEIAWQVIMRLAKGLRWKLLDPATGRELNP